MPDLDVAPDATACGHWPSSWFQFLYQTELSVVRCLYKKLLLGIVSGMIHRFV